MEDASGREGRIGRKATQLVARARQLRLSASFGFIAVVAITSVLVGDLPLVRDYYVFIVGTLFLFGFVCVVLIWRRAASVERAAGVEAGRFLNIPIDSPAFQLPRAVVRAPIPVLDSWLEVNQIRLTGVAESEHIVDPHRGSFRANWTPLIVGAMVALVSSIGLLVAIIVVVISEASRTVLVPVIFTAGGIGLIVGLVVMYRASMDIARARTEWLESNSGN